MIPFVFKTAWGLLAWRGQAWRKGGQLGAAGHLGER